MSTMISEVYDAFVEAGASQDKARKAAEAVANYETRFSSVDQRIVAFQAEVNQWFAKLGGDMTLLKWMLGAVIGGITTLVLKAFFT